MENNLTGLGKYTEQIDTSRHGDYRINERYSFHESIFKRSSDMRVICAHIFQRQHQQMKNY